MNWGSKIVIAFVVFAGIMGTMVVISMNQQVNLVSDDYYLQEIAYEDQIERLRNTRTLAEQPTISLNRETSSVEIAFPEQLQKDFKSGEIHLFRPSDRRFDVKKPISFKEGIAEISMSTKLPGLWRVKVSWSDMAKEYYLEKKIVL